MRLFIVPLRKLRSVTRPDTNSLLAGGLLVLLLAGYIALAYVAVLALGTLLLGDRPNPTFSPSLPLNVAAIVVIALGLRPVSRCWQFRPRRNRRPRPQRRRNPRCRPR